MSVRFDQDAVARLLVSEDGDVGRWLLTAATNVEGRAKHACPVDTGRLRASITHTIGRDGDGLFADVGTDVEYGPYVEFGTRHQRPQPFLRPALYEEARRWT